MPLRADIGTKTADHHAHMLMAIAAGKHVLCEKPFTDTAEQAREVYAAAEAKGLFKMLLPEPAVTFWLFFNKFCVF